MTKAEILDIVIQELHKGYSDPGSSKDFNAGCETALNHVWNEIAFKIGTDWQEAVVSLKTDGLLKQIGY